MAPPCRMHPRHEFSALDIYAAMGRTHPLIKSCGALVVDRGNKKLTNLCKTSIGNENNT